MENSKVSSFAKTMWRILAAIAVINIALAVELGRATPLHYKLIAIALPVFAAGTIVFIILDWAANTSRGVRPWMVQAWLIATTVTMIASGTVLHFFPPRSIFGDVMMLSWIILCVLAAYTYLKEKHRQR